MRKLMIAVAAAAIAAVVSGGAVSAEHEKEVQVKGSEDFEPNALFKINLGVTLILTMHFLPVCTQGNDFPRQRHCLFIRLDEERPSAFEPLTLTQRPKG